MHWTLRTSFRFEASHQLVNHDGKCARLHGHSWVGWVEVSGPRLISGGPKENMLIDYGDLKAPIADMVRDFLDHHHLNDTLNTDMPTSEFLATWIHTHLALGYRQKFGVHLDAVVVEETCTSYCEFRMDPGDD